MLLQYSGGEECNPSHGYYPQRCCRNGLQRFVRDLRQMTVGPRPQLGPTAGRASEGRGSDARGPHVSLIITPGWVRRPAVRRGQAWSPMG